MFKNTPKERLSEVDVHFRGLEQVAYFASCAAVMALFVLRHGDFPNFVGLFFIMLFLFAAQIASSWLGIILWVPLTAWMGHLSFREALSALTQPNANPKSVTRFLEGWWKNEFVLDAFVVVFRVLFCVASYRLFGPSVGIL